MAKRRELPELKPIRVGDFDVQVFSSLQTGLYGALLQHVQTKEWTVIPPTFDGDLSWHAAEKAYRAALKVAGVDLA